MGNLGEFAANDEDGWQAKAADIEAIASARHADPFAILGPHLTRAGWAIRAFAPDVVSVRAVTRDGTPSSGFGLRAWSRVTHKLPATGHYTAVRFPSSLPSQRSGLMLD